MSRVVELESELVRERARLSKYKSAEKTVSGGSLQRGGGMGRDWGRGGVEGEGRLRQREGTGGRRSAEVQFDIRTKSCAHAPACGLHRVVDLTTGEEPRKINCQLYPP